MEKIKTDDEIVLEMTERLKEAIPALMGETYKLDTSNHLRADRRYSFVFYYWALDEDGQKHPIFLKIPHPESMKTIGEAIQSEKLREELAREHETLNKFSDAIVKSGRRDLSTIKPLGYFSEFNAIFMNKVRMKMLKERLNEPGIILGYSSHRASFLNQVQRAGEWIRIIHNEFHQGRETLLRDTNQILAIENEYAAIEKMLKKGFPQSFIKFSAVYEKYKNEILPISSLHDDFHLGNVFILEDGSIGALDPNWKDAGIAYRDVANLLIDPVTRKHQILTHGKLYGTSLIKQYEQATLKGYFGPQQKKAPILLDYFCAVLVLSKWRDLLESIEGSLFSRAKSLYISRYFLNVIDFYLERELRK